ncbi:MAG: 50S ribosomal protein L6 [Clostridiales bacterium]|jgi:large subunit ribosomal protein L6|nr:50S ribosomal protein L6 [Clostridiales bacterium]
MSRIGIKPVAIPAGVEVTVDAKNVVTVKGPNGELSQQVNKDLTVEIAEGKVVVSRPSDARLYKAQHGLARTLISNLIEGVTNGFSKKLEIVGVGYKADKKGDDLVMNLGYSHQVIMKDPEGITTEVPTATQIIIKGNDKAVVGNYAANIRKWRKPEPYKGKGIRYEGEIVRRKEGKTGAK